MAGTWAKHVFDAGGYVNIGTGVVLDVSSLVEGTWFLVLNGRQLSGTWATNADALAAAETLLTSQGGVIDPSTIS